MDWSLIVQIGILICLVWIALYLSLFNAIDEENKWRELRKYLETNKKESFSGWRRLYEYLDEILMEVRIKNKK